MSSWSTASMEARAVLIMRGKDTTNEAITAAYQVKTMPSSCPVTAEECLTEETVVPY